MTTHDSSVGAPSGYVLRGTVMTDGEALENQALVIRDGHIDYLGPMPEVAPSGLTGLSQINLP